MTMRLIKIDKSEIVMKNLSLALEQLITNIEFFKWKTLVGKAEVQNNI